MGVFFVMLGLISFGSLNKSYYMKFFYLSSNTTPLGESEIHERNCPRIPSLTERSYLGPFMTANEALKQARRFKPKAVLCTYCCQEDQIGQSVHPMEKSST